MHDLIALLSALSPFWALLSSLVGGGTVGGLTVRAVRRMIRAELHPLQDRIERLEQHIHLSPPEHAPWPRSATPALSK